MNWLMLIFGLLVTTAIVTIVVIQVKRSQTKSVYKDSCTSDKDCKITDKCVYDRDYNRHICVSKDKTECNLQPYTSLVECELGQTNDVCGLCINSPEWKCVQVTDSNPYTWVQDGTKLTLPNSNPGKGWCLPPVIQTSPCNNLTSDSILIETTDNQGKTVYEWGCHCQIPNLITQDIPGDNCNVELACGYPNDGELYVPVGSNKCSTDTDCQTGQSCIDYSTGNPPETGSKGVCFASWLSNQNVDPRSGVCMCKPGLTYNGINNDTTGTYIKNCVTDTCAPNGTSDGKNSCVCNPGFIRCPDDVSNKTLICAKPTCIPDPCKPNGTFDQTSKSCICNGQNWANTTSEDSTTGWICKNLCDPGPCGNTGTCVVTGNDPNKVAVCENCVCPWTNEAVGSKPAVTNCSNNNNLQLSGTSCGFDSVCCSGNCVGYYTGHGICA